MTPLLIVHWIVAMCLLCLGVFSSSNREEYNTTGCNPHQHNLGAVALSKEKALRLLATTPAEPPLKDRLVVNILFSRGFHADHAFSNRLEYLHCALLKLQTNLMSSTPADVFLWTLNSTAHPAVTPAWLTAAAFPRVHVMEIEPETWLPPCGLVGDAQWTVREHFDLDYYLMGRWRLAFGLDLARALGYRFHLQLDDDALLVAPLKVDLVRRMSGGAAPPAGSSQQRAPPGGYQMGVLNDAVPETPAVTLGLPELAAYWLRIRKTQPKGPLAKHLRNRNLITGLNSDSWDRVIYPGYFLVTALDFWFQEDTQDFLTLVLRSGRDVEGRWQEQAVMNMARLLLVAEGRLAILSEAEVLHERHKKSVYTEHCSQAAATTLSTTSVAAST